MSTDRTFLNPLNEADDDVRDVEIYLNRLALAFDMIGNEKMADDLRFRAVDLGTARRRIAEGRNMALNRYIQGAENGTINMVNAALAVVIEKNRSENTNGNLQ